MNGIEIIKINNKKDNNRRYKRVNSGTQIHHHTPRQNTNGRAGRIVCGPDNIYNEWRYNRGIPGQRAVSISFDIRHCDGLSLSRCSRSLQESRENNYRLLAG